MVGHAEIWYYIPSGKNPKEFGHFSSNGDWMYVIVRDNSGQFWIHCTDAWDFKNNLFKNTNYYLDAFNKGILWNGGNYDANGFPRMDTPHEKVKYFIDKDQLNKRTIFSRLIILDKTSKCTTSKCTDSYYFGVRGNYAFSLDYKTMIKNYDSRYPKYYTCIPLQQFVERQSLDDLF